MLERKTGKPLPALVIQATPLKSLPRHLRPLYRMTAQVLEMTYGKLSNVRRKRVKAA